jgi:site-specific recombinase XerD
MDQQQIIEKLARDIELRGLSKSTNKEYCQRIKLFQEYFKKPSTELWEQEIREYLYYLRNDRKLSTSAVNMTNCALRFLYDVTLEKNLNNKRVPRLKQPYIHTNNHTKDQVQDIFK